MSILLTGRISGASGVAQLHDVIASSATANVDIIPMATYRSTKYLVTITDDTANKSMAYEVLAMHKQLTTASHNRYGILGDIIAHDLDVQVIGTDLVLKITNNEAHSITVDVVRMPTLA